MFNGCAFQVLGPANAKHLSVDWRRVGTA